MITKLHLQNFKNFRDASLSFGPFTILFGANASGKSNVRDALRFLHGIARGYTLADTIGQRFGEGGELQWRGLRGGTAEVVRHGAATFVLSATVGAHNSDSAYMFEIEVEPGRNGKPRLVRESLYINQAMLYDSHPAGNPPQQQDSQHLTVRIPPGGRYRGGHVETFIANQPVLTQIVERIDQRRRRDGMAEKVTVGVKNVISDFASMRFLDFSLDAMRLPSLSGQTTLGDRGENLSSVLQAIYEDAGRRASLIEWMRELTPMDVLDFAFPADQTGRVLVTLQERDGAEISAYSASDGTLRFLSVLAALLGPEPAHLYVFEELENGLHPARLHLLIDLIEKRVAGGDLQIVATTHSSQLLRLLSPHSLGSAALVYRLADQSEAQIQQLGDLPAEALHVIKQKDVGVLLASGWFENVASFMTDGGA